MNDKFDSATSGGSFQQRVQPWMLACFGEKIAGDREERNHRFLEEALELVQSTSCTASEAHQLVDYVYGRPVGEPAQEVGGVMVTLAALCLANDLDMHMAAETELARIWTKVEQIRAKQAAKPKHSPLPAAPSPAPESHQPMTASYVQDVPDQCDRIIWRGAYYHLSEGKQPGQARPVVDANFDISTLGHIHLFDLDGMLVNYLCAAAGARRAEYKAAIIEAFQAAMQYVPQPIVDAAPVEAKPVAWEYEVEHGGEWLATLRHHAPLDANNIRNVRSLIYAQPSTAHGDALSQQAAKIAESAVALRALYHNTYCNPEGFQLQVETNASEAAVFLRALVAKPAETTHPAALVPTAMQERAWFKEWVAGRDGSISVDAVEFGRLAWAERALRAAKGGA